MRSPRSREFLMAPKRTTVRRLVRGDPERAKRIAKVVSRFLAGQTLVQGINLITGLLLLRWLPIESYAQYGVAFAFQSTLNMLVDLGFSSTIVGLVGHRGNEPAILGGYIRSARTERMRMFIILGAISAIAFPLDVAHKTWSLWIKLALWASIVASVFVQSQMVYGAALLITSRVGKYYRSSLSSSVFRIASFTLFHFGFGLVGWIASWINTIGILINGSLYRFFSRDVVVEPHRADPEMRREMRLLIRNNLPSFLFYSLQGQITVMIISIFGHGDKSLAEVTALGRLSQIFTLLAAVGPVLVEPFIARSSREHLLRKYLQIMVLALAVAVTMTCAAVFFPQIFELILGPKYQHLDRAIGYLVAGSSAAFFTDILWTMNSARKWVYFQVSIGYVVFVGVVQIIALFTMKLDTT